MLLTVTIYAVFIICAYLWGSLNFAILISKLKGRDIRKLGSGNAGTMNIRRNFGFKFGVLCLLLDMLKGLLPSIIGWWLLGGAGRGGFGTERFGFNGDNRIGIYIGGFTAVFGHIFPIWYKFKGGKGIASSIGVGLAINPLLTIICFFVAIVFMIITAMGSVTSFLVITPPLIYELLRLHGGGVDFLAAQILVFGLFFLTMWAHRMNFVRLFAGNESKTVVFGKKRKARAKEAKAAEAERQRLKAEAKAKSKAAV
ncbi:MAG: glycerol-3-phosphate acyltransferase [Firmicutes bacterium]|nr:glycerol-3-phosphate acyltransferase [Bacillota bacterium]